MISSFLIRGLGSERLTPSGSSSVPNPSSNATMVFQSRSSSWTALVVGFIYLHVTVLWFFFKVLTGAGSSPLSSLPMEESWTLDMQSSALALHTCLSTPAFSGPSLPVWNIGRGAGKRRCGYWSARSQSFRHLLQATALKRKATQAQQQSPLSIHWHRLT